MPFEQDHTSLEHCKTIIAFIVQLVGNVINTAYNLLCSVENIYSWHFVLYLEMSLTQKIQRGTTNA